MVEKRKTERGRKWNTNNVKAVLKKRGAIGLIVTILGIGGVGLGSIGLPGLLMVHMKETMIDKWNDQLAALDVRSNRALAKKIGKDVTSGVCSQLL